jgi:hypothetical protein
MEWEGKEEWGMRSKISSSLLAQWQLMYIDYRNCCDIYSSKDETKELSELSAFSGEIRYRYVYWERQTELSTQFGCTTQEPSPRPRDIYLCSHYLVASSRANNVHWKARKWRVIKWIHMKMEGGILYCMAFSMGKSIFSLILFVTRCTYLFLRSSSPRVSLGHEYYIEQVQQKPIPMSTVGVMFQQKVTRCLFQA